MVEPRPYHPALTIDVNRFAVAGCWHRDLEWADTAMRSAKERGADILIHTGDFGYNYPGGFVNGMQRLVDRYDLPVAFIDGNHDDHRFLRKLPQASDGSGHLGHRLHYLPRAFRWQWGEVTFLALGGARSVDRARRHLDREPYWWSTETITGRDIAAAQKHGPVDVLVSHDAPSGVLIPNFDRYSFGYGDTEILAAQAHRQALRDVVDHVRPRLIIHGHYHVYHSQSVEFGYGDVAVLGLDRDGSTKFRNVYVLDVSRVQEWTKA